MRSCQSIQGRTRRKTRIPGSQPLKPWRMVAVRHVNGQKGLAPATLLHAQVWARLRMGGILRHGRFMAFCPSTCLGGALMQAAGKDQQKRMPGMLLNRSANPQRSGSEKGVTNAHDWPWLRTVSGRCGTHCSCSQLISTPLLLITHYSTSGEETKPQTGVVIRPHSLSP